VSQARLRATTPRELPSLSSVVFSLLFLATVTLLSWAALELRDPGALPIRRVVVEGTLVHLDASRIEAVVAECVHAGFFGIDVDDIRARLQDEPWVRDAAVRRVWPDSLHVAIAEQVAVARWGDYGLLNAEADLFVPAPEELPADLVRLDGPLGTELEVLRRYRFVAERLGALGLRVAAVELSARHAWSVTTDGGHQIVFGRKDFDARLARFELGYRRALAQAWARIARVDLRYTNGFAVGERPADERSG